MAHPSLQTRCCAVILAGGRNTRMAGRNKAFLKVGGRTILERMIAILTPLLGRPLLVTRQPELYAPYPVRVVEDIHPARSSLTGIHAGLVHTATEYAFVVPCDAPFLRPTLVEALLAEITPAVDVVVPWVNGFYEPLCAIYAKRCLPAIEARLRRGAFKITGFYDQVRVKTVSAEKLQSADGRMASFFNVNTPDALEASRDLLEED
ncbi:molybdenum cofactor guanylyltransferase [Desulfatitalea alkaliphila]|uniref:Probable molybdenum cofactor guanylyltransferase n=1 Tax=Desulfatitalea alkaliphila TaxID=2929485 RepID=A0AA41UKD5_9BACT|nr:molybdenum cofactor guanylyltransferase [Desulfatitalea alkaliphila]MCJ8500311.1 molybdenum cofactor guanylyltransferase [Desulfatitalea alkaliphila]